MNAIAKEIVKCLERVSFPFTALDSDIAQWFETFSEYFEYFDLDQSKFLLQELAIKDF